MSETRVGVARCAGYRDRDALAAAVREAVRHATGGSIAQLVGPGSTVLLKPNWVTDRNRSGAGSECLITHPSVIEAVLHDVLEAKPARVVIADAPIQSADFDRVVPVEWRARMQARGRVDILDLRNVVRVMRDGVPIQHATQRAAERVALFDLGTASLLEPVSSPAGRFRCTSYNPDRIIAIQRPGVHHYKICKEPLEADLVINLPKLKSHGKAGLTGALKNVVGINGDKDYLPHHRTGSPDTGGDCYAEAHLGKRVSELLLDASNRRIGRPGHRIASLVAGAAVRGAQHVGLGGLEGAWYGNDTVWRMTLDLDRILLYGRPDGSMAGEPQRRVLTITDAIVAGEGDGPLAPTPNALGLVTAALSPVFADLVHAALMRFDWQRVPLVAGAFGEMRWPLTEARPDDVRVISRERTYTLAQAAGELGKPFRAPHGWRGHVEAHV